MFVFMTAFRIVLSQSKLRCEHFKMSPFGRLDLCKLCLGMHEAGGESHLKPAVIFPTMRHNMVTYIVLHVFAFLCYLFER